MTFKYSAMDAQGKERKGRIDADNENDANAKLKEQGLFPTSINKESGKAAKEKMKSRPTIFEIFGYKITIERL